MRCDPMASNHASNHAPNGPNHLGFVARSTEDPTDPASFHYTPWRSPGHAPTSDAWCIPTRDSPYSCNPCG